MLESPSLVELPTSFKRLAKCISIILWLVGFLSFSPPASGYWVWSPESGKFVNPEAAVEDTADQQYEYALSYFESRDYSRAVDELTKLTKKFPGSRISPEAQFKLGEIHEQQNEFYKAFRSYQKLVDNYPQSPRVNEVIEKQFRIGNVFLSGRKPKLLGVPILPALPRAIEVFDQVVKNAPFGEFGEKALFNLGIAYKRSGNFPKALETFQQLIDNYPQSVFLPDAKYQLGEVSFEISKNINRSQEGLDSAKDYFESFLKEYPESNVREKATELKKAIDEKNAEKNFKIAQYYERENYLESAIIYYQDVAKNYSDTSWAAKAREKMAIFRSPVKYIKQKEEILQGEVERVILRKREWEEKMARLPESAGEKRKELQENIRQLEAKEKELRASVKSFGRRKASDIKRRREALERKETELRDKTKTLEKKRHALKANRSADLKRAFAMWSESLRNEQRALDREKIELEKIERELGISTGMQMPFLGRREPIDRIRRMHINELSELLEEKRMWDVKKDELYEFRRSVLARLEGLRDEDIDLLTAKSEFEHVFQGQGREWQEKREKLVEEKADLDTLRVRFESKKRAFEKISGTRKWSRVLRAPERVLKRSFDLMTFVSKDPKSRLEEARRRERTISEGIHEKRSVIDAIQRAFQEELERPYPHVSDGEKEGDKSWKKLPEEIRLKKKIKLVEREIRWRYDEIQDRNQSKRAYMEELDSLLAQVKEGNPVVSRAGQAVATPATGMYRFFHAFLFGLKQKEETIRSEALHVKSGVTSRESYERIQKLRENIELESLVIEARAREIEFLKKDLEPLKLEGAARRGFSYRSVFIERPGNFLQDAVSSARKVFPRKERREILVEKLDEETRQLEKLADEKILMAGKMKELEREVQALSTRKNTEPREELASKPRSRTRVHGKRSRVLRLKALERELGELEKEVRVREAEFGKDRERIHGEFKKFYRRNFSKRIRERFGLDDKDFERKRKLFDKERRRTEEELLKIVKKEEKIVDERKELLSEKKKKIKRKIGKYKEKNDYRSEVLENDLEELLVQARQVEMERKTLLEEKKKLSENLNAEVGSFEK